MKLTSTDKKNANAILILPIVGQVTLDANASFDCDPKKVEEFQKALEGNTLQFVKEGEVISEKKKEKSKKEKEVKEKEVKGGEEKEELVKEEKPLAANQIDTTALRDAVQSADSEELKDYVELISDQITVKQLKDLDTEGLRKLILSKIPA